MVEYRTSAIAVGHCDTVLCIADGYVVDITEFITAHPGGRAKILSIVNRDDFSFDSHFAATSADFKKACEEFEARCCSCSKPTVVAMVPSKDNSRDLHQDAVDSDVPAVINEANNVTVERRLRHVFRRSRTNGGLDANGNVLADVPLPAEVVGSITILAKYVAITTS